MGKLYVSLVLILCNFVALFMTEICKKETICQCKYGNGSRIDLTAISEVGKPRFRNVSWLSEKDWLYSYNPCSSFKEGPAGSATDVNSCNYGDGVTVCQNNGTSFFGLGLLNSSSFAWNETTKLQTLSYVLGNNVTVISLKCDFKNVKNSSLVIDNVVNNGTRNIHYMILESIYACPDPYLVPESNKRTLSTGSILVIIFFVASFVYFFGGMLLQTFGRGATGLEIIPNYEFWIDFPLLIRDGIIFVLNGCTTQTMYDRI